jgi:stage V sporulation protein G
MLTKIEQEYYEHSTEALVKLVEEVTKLREAVEKCSGRPLPEPKEATEKEEHPIDSTFDVLAVTDVQVFPFKEGVNLGHFKGCATIVLNDQLQIRGLRVMEGENGLYVGYPNDPFYKGENLRSVCFPMTRQLREHIENCVLEKYQAVTK